MADRYQKQIYFPKEEEEILKEINIRSEQVIEKFECSGCRKKKEVFYGTFFLQKGYDCCINIYHLKNGESRPKKVRKIQTNWFTSEDCPDKLFFKKVC